MGIEYRWKRCLEVGARELLRGVRRRKSQEVRRLEEENRRLSEALVLQSQELMLLKKEKSGDRVPEWAGIGFH